MGRSRPIVGIPAQPVVLPPPVVDPIHPPDGWTSYPECPGCGCQDPCFPCSACPVSYPSQWDLEFSAPWFCDLTSPQRLTMIGECQWFREDPGWVPWHNPTTYELRVYRDPPPSQRVHGTLTLRDIFGRPVTFNSNPDVDFNCCGVNTLTRGSGEICTGLDQVTVRPVLVGGQCECVVIPPPETCCPEPVPARVRLLLTNRSNCACWDGFFFDLTQTAPGSQLWLADPNPPYPCGLGQALNRDVRLACDNRTPANYDFSIFWLRDNFAEPEFVGASTGGQGICQNPDISYPLLGAAKVCNPFFMQWQGVRICWDPDLGNPPTCSGGDPLNMLVDVTAFPL